MKKILKYLNSKSDVINLGTSAYVQRYADEDTRLIQTSQVIYIYYNVSGRVSWFETLNTIYFSETVDHDTFCDNSKFVVMDIELINLSSGKMKDVCGVHSIRSKISSGIKKYDVFFHDESSKTKFMMEYL